jgi:amino acid adenylation domain-containing protein/FkbH-like protein
MKEYFESAFPRNLELWLEGEKLKYVVEEKKLDSSKTDFLKSNKDFFKGILTDTNSKRIKVLPLSQNQKALWFLRKVSPGNVSYNISLAAEFKEPLVIDAFRNTLSSLVLQHPMLRTVFADLPGNNIPCQIVLERIDPVIELIDSSNLNHDKIKNLLKEKLRKPFDFENGPLFRSMIVTSPHSTILSLNFHHIICDAISLRNFFNEFISLYDSLVTKVDIKQKSPFFDYGNFIFDQLDFLKSKLGENRIQYWVEQLKGKPLVLDLPSKAERPKVHQFNGSTLLFNIENERFTKLRSIVKENNITFNVLLCSAFEFFISKISGQSDFCFGMPAAARINKTYEDVFGYFINLLPIGCSLNSEKKFIDFLGENKKQFYEGLENQSVPFPVIVANLAPKRDLSRTPVFQVIFNYLNKKSLGSLIHFLCESDSSEYESWGSTFIKPFRISDQEGQVDLTLEITDNDKKLFCALKYNSDLFDSETAEKFKNDFLIIIDLIINDLQFKPFWLDKEIHLKPHAPVLTINITGTFTVEPVKPFLEFWLNKFGVSPSINFPGYNQVFPQILNPGSEFNSNKGGYNVLLIRSEDWVTDKNSKVSVSDVENKIKEFEKDLSSAFQINSSGKYIIVFCPRSTGVLKNLPLSESIIKAESQAASVLGIKSNVVVINSDELIGTYNISDYYEEVGEKIGHIPFSENFFTSLATIIARKIHISFSLPFKAIAVDCDNTLWKGVVAEDGPLAVKVGINERALQEFLIGQYNSGILICLCSKNIEDDVFEVFDKNNQMILKREHIALYRINWISKSENLVQLAKDLNIGLDSFVFIDDNPMECAEVRENVPDVLTIQLPEGGFNAGDLQNTWIFDKLRITEEDRKRSEKYREESIRNNFRVSLKSYKEFIKGLDLKIEIKPFQEENIPRISQLTYRTNQFNSTTLRRSENEIKNISNDPTYDSFQVSLADRFGDYGLTGIIIADKSIGYIIDTFLLSCRVLGKGVEHFLISYLGKAARQNSNNSLSINFRKTSKNTPIENFLVSNFGEQVSVRDGTQTFKIDIEKAIDFTFDPEKNISDPIQEVVENRIAYPEDKTIETRNNFYYQILEKYLSIEKIAAELNVISPAKPAENIRNIQQYKKAEKNVMSVWIQVLRRDDFSLTDNFFDVGGSSILIPQIVINLYKQFNIQIEIVDIFQFPTVKELASHIEAKVLDSKAVKSKAVNGKVRDGMLVSGEPSPGIIQQPAGQKSTGNDIAIIGMAGRFSGAKNLDEYWQIISNGEEAITHYTKEELLNKGVDKKLLENENYVLANGIIESADKFDATFFGITPREADFMDPQHRVFLESCYEALENAGYTSEKYPGEIGVFGGCGMNNYLVKNLIQHPDSLRLLGEFQSTINNNSDYLTTRVSYKLNLTGPSINIQTACSTSLVAIHTACQNLISRSCDMALAGGTFIQIPHAEGYLYEPGGIFSPDGHCKPFDSSAGGTLFGEGSGVIVLKRLEDSMSDCDTILGVIKGSAINNDGSNKVGYMAPSVNGQSAVVRKAIIAANVSPDTISYIETHGTGTKLGDPIEVNSLSQVYKSYTDRRNFCALGSVKANIGHLDAAAGIAGVIKVVLMFKNRKLPPTVNFMMPNPEINLEDSPFYISTTLNDWNSGQKPVRAGISSFGVGGTNAHCILEEAPETIRNVSEKKYHLLPITAKTPKALDLLKQNITRHLLNSTEDIADISYTLQQGRTHHNKRSLLICKKESDSINPVEVIGEQINGLRELINPRVVFMFTGQGSQYVGMAQDLYFEFSTFRDIVDKADIYLKENFNIGILKYILRDENESLQNDINQTSIAQPLLFTVQYAISRLLDEFGIKPDAVIGHSIGEYTSAAVSGIFSFEDALKLVAWRGKLMQDQKPGAMLSVQLSYNEVLPFISDKVNLSLRNAPNWNVLAGDIKDIDELNRNLTIAYPNTHISRLNTSHAFHSYMMEPVLDPFRKILETINFRESNIPIISNRSGSLAGCSELSNADYWIDQIRSTVNFVDGVQELLDSGETYFIEIGPGNTLETLLSQYVVAGKKIYISSTVRHPKKKLNDVTVFLRAVCSAWVSGVEIQWDSYYKSEKRFRVPLPGYPFEKERHWIDPAAPFDRLTEDSVITSQSGAVPYDVVSDKIKSIESTFPFHSRPLMENEYVAPKSEIEKAIAKIWEDLLGIKGIGLNDDFFFLGGHSLLASQIVNRISEKFNVRLSLELLFTGPTINGLIKKIESVIPVDQGSPDIISIDPGERLPVSYDQRRLWIINQIDGSNPGYNIPFTYRLKGNLNDHLFKKSLKILFDRHSILRSTIKTVDGEPYCFVNILDNIPVESIDLSTSEPHEVEVKIQNLFTTESRKVFDIENGPLYRLYLVKISKSEFIFHMTVHHIIFDGWSWGIFAGELRQIYNDLLNKREVSLKPLQFQYYDIANWQKSNIMEEMYKESIGYWKTQLRDHPSEINFPYDFNRKLSPSGFGGRVAMKLSPELSAKIRNLSQKGNATTFMTLLAAFGLLLNKYSGDDDICIGAPTANRGNSNVEGIIGFFVNTIILRLGFDNSQSFLDLLKLTRKTTLDALAHQDLPFEKLVDTMQPERKLNVNPITQILFAYQNTPRPPLDLEGIKPERVLIVDTVSPLDITFYAWDYAGIVEGEFEFNSDILDRETIIRLKDNFINLLENVIENPEQRISEITTVSEFDKIKTEEFNSTKAPIPDCMVQDFFEKQVMQTPDKIAVISNSQRLTYRELDEKANKLSRHLIEIGVVPGETIGIFIGRSADMVIAVLAVLKSGCCYLPLDPAFPIERLRNMSEDSGTKVIVSHSSLKDKYEYFADAVIVALDEKKNKINKYTGDKPKISYDPQLPVYLIYTSGSTGKPKGVKVHHRAVVNLIVSMSKTPGINKNDILLAVVTLSFDMSVFELFLPLSNGATIVIADSQDIRDGDALKDLIEEHNITVLQAAPSLYHILLSSGWKGKRNLKALCGGEALTNSMVIKILPMVDELWNCYGPTETTVYSTFARIIDPNKKILIGKPINNTRIYILDKYNKMMPIGAIGEIGIAGEGVAQGYINQPELTLEKFIRFDDNNIVYKTGDRGRLIKDGSIELFGRIDNQIKIRGIRIEPGEIEILLSGIEGINDAVIKAQKFDENDDRLVAYLSVSKDFSLDPRKINARIKQKLPIYMIPSIYKIMGEFPRTSNGKIDRKALVVDTEDIENTPGDLIKLSPTENVIHGIWCETLRTENILVTDNFFEIGGNSILAISAFSKILTAFNLQLGLRVFFDSPRIKDLSETFDIIIQNSEEIESRKKIVTEKYKIVKGEI